LISVERALGAGLKILEYLGGIEIFLQEACWAGHPGILEYLGGIEIVPKWMLSPQKCQDFRIPRRD